MPVTEQKTYAFFQGNIVPIEDAKISIMNHSFMYGTAVFEGIRGYWNEKDEEMYLYRLREHFERMAVSMKIMYLRCNRLITLQNRRGVGKKNAQELILIFVNCLQTVHRVGQASIIILLICAFSPCLVIISRLVAKSTNLELEKSEDNAIPARAKIVGAYANTALAKTDAVMAGFDDCIVLSENGHVSEGSAMNVFMVKNGRLITTPSYENILEGVTRRTIMEFAEAELGLKAESRQIDRSELYIADELFFCGTGAQIAPIIEIDRVSW
jgi:branched-chain amino acid aminotransferase